MARKEKMKVYHGIPKSITDEHTIFYAENVKSNKITPMPTGYGGILDGLTPQHLLVNNLECLSVDFWIYERKQSTSAGAWCSLLEAYSNNTRQLTITHDQYNLFVSYPNFNWNNSFRFPLGKNTHVRVVIKNNCIFVYLNGNLHYTNISTGYNLLAVTKLVFFEGGHNNSSEIYISDFHVSNIDRGDYFPNLPQDFIEGKAVIKPRMGQQQIKGDPMYSQVTNLKVEASTGVEYPTLVDNNYYRHRHNPELSVKGANHWNAGSSFRIKGLNGEIISGVIDTDTALAKVTKSNLNNRNILTLDLDDVSKFSVGDTIVLYVADTGHYTSEATIQSIDTENKVITLASKLINPNGVGPWGVVDLSQHPNQYVFETTLSSSSPTVKTKEGTNVVGTWSGLGTREATFTLGENTNITGKDLYVEYSLTMPYGNSDFPELPYSIERAWGENGVEMKPVTQIVIVDDFKGKIVGSTEECPHNVKYRLFNSLSIPSDITEEISAYTISTLDSNTMALSETREGYFPQQLFSFNLIEMVERKLGCEIPSRDKVQWLKENLDYIGMRWYGYGTSHLGNKARCEVYFYDTNNYSNTGIGNTSSSPTLCQLDMSSTYVPKVINSDGMVSFIVFTNASNGSTASIINTDYVALDIMLKKNSSYTYLYGENTRAREDVCNPVLVQKETKTVKRYLPSKEIFSTECLYAKFKNEGVVSGLDILANKHVNIGVTTSEYNKFVSGSKINLNQLPLEKSEHLYTPILDSNIMDSIPNHVGADITELPVIHWWSDNGDKLFTVPTTETLNFKTCVNGTNALKGQIGGYKDVNNNIIIYGDVDKSNILTKDGLRLYDISLVNKDGELMLYVIKSSEGNRFYFYNDAITLIKVPYRPLIK